MFSKVAPKRIAGAPQLGDVAHEAEGAGAGNFAAERLRRQVEGDRLAADQRIVERDLDFEAEAARIRAAIRRSNRRWRPASASESGYSGAAPASVTMPACSMAATKAAALPSMIGTSGPSISISALSTPRPDSAARTCSAVEHSGPSASPSTVANSVAVTARTSARTSRSRQPSMPVRRKLMPLIGVGGMDGERDRQAPNEPRCPSRLRCREASSAWRLSCSPSQTDPAVAATTRLACTRRRTRMQQSPRPATIGSTLTKCGMSRSAVPTPNEIPTNPLDSIILTGVANRTNSRFFTECYSFSTALRHIAAIPGRPPRVCRDRLSLCQNPTDIIYRCDNRGPRLRSPAGAGKPGYRAGRPRLPSAARAPGGHGCRGPAGGRAWHIPTPAPRRARLCRPRRTRHGGRSGPRPVARRLRRVLLSPLLGLWLVLAPAETDRGQALQQGQPALLRMVGFGELAAPSAVTRSAPGPAVPRRSACAARGSPAAPAAAG